MAKDPVSQTMSIAMMADIKRRGGNMDRVRDSLHACDVAQGDVRQAQSELRRANHALHERRTELVGMLINEGLHDMLMPDTTRLRNFLRADDKARYHGGKPYRAGSMGENLLNDIATDETKR